MAVLETPFQLFSGQILLAAAAAGIDPVGHVQELAVVYIDKMGRLQRRGFDIGVQVVATVS